MKNRKEDLSSKVENLEKTVENLRKEILEVKSMIGGLKSMIDSFSEQLPLRSTVKTGTAPLGGPMGSQSRVNPWTQEAWSDVLRALESLTREPPIEFSKETFGPTIAALRKEEKGMTATDVAKITGRKRNTESFYLKRLYLAGITIRGVRGRKVLYSLTDDKTIHEKYSHLFT